MTHSGPLWRVGDLAAAALYYRLCRCYTLEDDLTHARDWLNGVANLKLKTDANGLLFLLPAACYFKSQLVKIQTEEKEEKNRKKKKQKTKNTQPK